MIQSIGPTLRREWKRFSGTASGRWVFSRLLGCFVPYTDSIGATIQTLEAGNAVVLLRDRRKVRNHLGSIHAVALCNLGEMVTGLALNMGLPSDARSILTGLSVEYKKKARGNLTAESRCPVPESAEEREYVVEGCIVDTAGDVVAIVEACWRVGPIQR